MLKVTPTTARLIILVIVGVSLLFLYMNESFLEIESEVGDTVRKQLVPANCTLQEETDDNLHVTAVAYMDTATVTGNVTSVPTSAPTALSDRYLRNFTGSWMGNVWIPPRPWQTFSVQELQLFYRHRNVFFVGDSMARQPGHALYAIMNTSTSCTKDGEMTTAVANTDEEEMFRVDHTWRGCTMPQFQSAGPWSRPGICGYWPVLPHTCGNPHKQRQRRLEIMEGTKHNHNDATPTPHNDTNVTNSTGTGAAFPFPTNTTNNSIPEDNTTGTADTAGVAPAVGIYANNENAYCLKRHIKAFFEQELEAHQVERDPMQKPKHTAATKNMDYIVVALGAWVEKTVVCHNWTAYNRTGDENDPNHLMAAMRSTVQEVMKTIYEFQKFTGILVVWRTSGFWADQTEFRDPVVVHALNRAAMDAIDEYRHRDPDCKLTYVNWGGAMEVRSFGKQRITGDHVAHYGMTAYVTLIQMITNRIRDMGLL